MQIQKPILEYLSKLSDKEWATLMRQVREHRKTISRRWEWDETYHFVAVVEKYIPDDAADGTPADPSQTEWLVYSLAPEDPEEYPDTPFEMLPDDAAEYAQCGYCRNKLLSHVKRALCPVCGNKVYLT